MRGALMLLVLTVLVPLLVVQAGIYTAWYFGRLSEVSAGLWIVGGLSLLVAIVSLLLARITSKSLIRQLQRLHSHAIAIGEGNYDHSTKTSGVMELAELAVAFNQMGEAVQKARSELETSNDALDQRVRKRTVELADAVRRLEKEVRDRINAEQSLVRSEQQYRSLTMATTSIVWITNEKGAVVKDLPSWRAFTGQSKGDIAGLGWNDALHPDDRKRAQEFWRKSVETCTQYDTEYRIRRKDGQYREMAVRGVPVTDQDGHIREWIGTCTEQKQVEEELAKHRDNLEEMVARRTHELQSSNRKLEKEIGEHKATGKELHRAVVKLARSNKELEQFAYVASHDLQEPLRVVSGYVQLIQRRYADRLDVDADQFIGYIVNGVTQMQQLITDLLNYSRVGTRGRPFMKVGLEAVLDRALVNLGEVVRESESQISHEPLPEIVGDETQLMQLFQNLIGNAVKFSGGRRPKINISVRQADEHWRFAVSDNGIGIDPKYWDKLFVIFQRLHSRQKYTGNGIGLAICKRIVERHGGIIWLDSKLSEGTTFFFTIKGNLPEESFGDSGLISLPASIQL